MKPKLLDQEAGSEAGSDTEMPAYALGQKAAPSGYDGFSAWLTKNYNLDSVLLLRAPLQHDRFGALSIVYANFRKVSALALCLNISEWSVLKPLQRSCAPFSFFTDAAGEARIKRAEDHSWEMLPGIDPLERHFFAAINAQSGCILPCLAADGSKMIALLTCGAEASEPDLGAIYIQLVSASRFEQTQRAGRRVRDRSVLNPRELECLSWVAAGKTSSEIARITSLSEHTVNHYLQVCCKKLDTVNRIQAVATALRLSLI